MGCCQPCLVYTRILLRNKAGNGEGEISGLQTLFPYHLPPSALVRSGGPLPSPSLWSPEASALPASPNSCGTPLLMMPQVTITKGAGLGAENTALIGLFAVALGRNYSVGELQSLQKTNFKSLVVKTIFQIMCVSGS